MVAESNLPKRARDLRFRLEDLEREFEESSKAFVKRLNERPVTDIEALLESGGVEAVEEQFNRQNEEDKLNIRNILAQEKRLLEAIEEVKMVETEANVEGTKLRFDVVKQQATFSVIAMAGVTAVTEGILPEELSLVGLFWASVGLLLATIVTSLFLLYLLTARVEYMLQYGQKPAHGSRVDRITELLYFSALGLPLAVVTFLIFAIYNFV